MHNSELFLAPLRGQEAVVSSRMEGIISTLDEILQLEAEFEEDNERAARDRLRAVSSDNDWEGWCAFFLAAVERQAIANLEAAQSIGQLYEEMKPRFAELLASKYAVAALDYLFTHPVFSNSRFTRSAGIPSQTAARFSRVLLQEGLLQSASRRDGARPCIASSR